MTMLAPHLDPQTWMIQLFSSKAAISGGVIRRQVKDIERIVGRVRFEREIKRRGYHCFENAGQLIIICNQEPVHMIC